MKVLAVVYGSPTPPGKLSRALDVLESHVSGNSKWETRRVSPTEQANGSGVFWNQTSLDVLAVADAVVMATPVFRGSMSAAVKLLLDSLPVGSLRSKPVGIFSIAAAAEHALGAERPLRDVLAWFGALTAPNPAFFVDKFFATSDVNEQVIVEIGEFVEQLVTLSEGLDGTQFGPAPLAARKPTG